MPDLHVFFSCYFRPASGEEGFVLVLRRWQLEQQRGLLLTICVSVNPPEYHLSADTEGTTALPSVAKLSAFVTENDFSPSVCAKLEQALWTGTLSDKPVLQLRRSSSHCCRLCRTVGGAFRFKWDPKK